MGTRSGDVAQQRGAESDRNPLDTTFGPHSRRAEQLKAAAHGGILEISDSALKELKLSTISNLGKIAERYPEALRYFPPGSRMVLSASYSSGDWGESGHLSVTCALKYPGENGGWKRSAEEHIHGGSSETGVLRKFEQFLELLENKRLDNE